MQGPTKTAKLLRGLTGRAVVEFNLIDPGDHIMVCLSGGKDSYSLLEMLLHLQRVAPIDFSLVAVNLDQKQPGFPEHILPDYLENKNLDFRIVQEDTYSIVKNTVPEGQTTCALCSRLRRGILYRVATELGANKIALGHHADDLLETLLLNLFHAGSLKAMPAKLHADDGRNIVIRPMVYCRERDIQAYSDEQCFPIIPCNLCGSQPNLQRQAMKHLLKDWEAQNPGRVASMLTAMGNVTPSHLLDQNLFDFSLNKRIENSAAEPVYAPVSSPHTSGTAVASTNLSTEITREFPLHHRPQSGRWA
ncbi:MAG: tRNA 2-thiocytidine(32) synthetase TtcA [Granulosicoccus sp.]